MKPAQSARRLTDVFEYYPYTVCRLVIQYLTQSQSAPLIAQRQTATNMLDESLFVCRELVIMRCEVCWIHQKGSAALGIMPRPRGGQWLEDEIHSLANRGVAVVVSLLTDEESIELELEQERDLCTTIGMLFLSFPVPDRSVPIDRDAAIAFVREVKELAAQGRGSFSIAGPALDVLPCSRLLF